jgi:uncharacterized protein YndB with AHSA1/START domain/uncharacterized protein YciI
VKEHAVSTVPPIRREVLVEAGPATAFEAFTAHIGRWWPLAELSVYGAGGSIEFSGTQLIERSAGGQCTVWGTVTRWEPATAVAFTWHPGGTPERASQVEVTFTSAGARTLVTLTHGGWHVFDDPAAARAEYEHGWPMVLGRYHDDADQRGQYDGGQTWVALLHRPGPAAPRDGTVFDDPRFAEHAAFLTRMRDAGYLVAAGPLTDALGEGMTILRLPGTNQIELATRLATHDDASVTGGFFTVTVRPWQVMMQAQPREAGNLR